MLAQTEAACIVCGEHEKPEAACTYGVPSRLYNVVEGGWVVKKIDATLRVETLSFGQAAGFIPQG